MDIRFHFQVASNKYRRQKSLLRTHPKKAQFSSITYTCNNFAFFSGIAKEVTAADRPCLQNGNILYTNLPVRESAAFPSFFCPVFLVVPSAMHFPLPQAWPAPEAAAYINKRTDNNTLQPHHKSTMNGK